MLSISTLITALAASSLTIPLANAKLCPPLGAVLPAPKAPSGSQAVKTAIEKLRASLDSDFASKLNASGISIGVKSIHEDAPLFSYHFTPPVMSGIGTKAIDDHTIYRVGSLSKLMPVLAVLQSNSINMEDSVLKYIPELKKLKSSDHINGIAWEDVTVGSLANHLSGLSTDMAMDLAIFSNGPWTKMGLPEVPKGKGPNCSGLPGTKPCTKKDLINHINSRPPVYSPFSAPVYSNIGFAILGMVVEAASGKQLHDVFRKGIYDVAGMKSTSFDGPVDSFSKVGFVPKGEPTWNATLGVFEAAGGMFSNTIDLLAFGEAILESRLLSPCKTRQWLKPNSHTSSLGYSVGSPWEILRSDTVTTDRRVIDIYTKSGDLGLYHALFGVLADHDVVISVLTAGPEVSVDAHARTKLFSSVIKTLLPAIEDASRDEASSSYGPVGSYADTSSNSSMVISMDSGPGLVLSNFTVHGFDVLNNIAKYSLGSAESGLSGGQKHLVEGRLYPTKTSNTGSKAVAKSDTKESAWRAVFDTTTDEKRKELDAQLFYKDGSCESWFGLDRSSYNYLSLAEFVFIRDKNGAVTDIRNPAFNVTMTKLGKTV